MSNSSSVPRLSIELVREAASRIQGRVVQTPTLRVLVGAGVELFLKVESLQPTGAFKLRGAFNFMLTLPTTCRGVVAHSSGNHALAVAYVAKELGYQATLVMPRSAPRVKRASVEALGARLVLVGADSSERASVCMTLAESHGWTIVPPFDHALIAAGQGTAALELLKAAPALDRFYAPISGGGLMAGCATAISALSASTEIIGAEPETSGKAQASLAQNRPIEAPMFSTLADGLCVRQLGSVNWPTLRDTVSRVEGVSDRELLDAMRFALKQVRLVLEPSGACALALALREGTGRCGVLLSGGNVDEDLLAQALAAPELAG